MHTIENLHNKIKEFWPKSGPEIHEIEKYVKKYSKEKLVIKCGGRVLLDPELFNNFINDVAILVRASFQTRSFEERFLKIGLPYQVIGGLRFYERVEIRDAVAYLRLINSPDDQLAFERIINKPKRGLGEKTLQKIEFYSRAKSINLETAIRRMNETDEFTVKIRLSMKLFIKNLDRWRNHIKSDKLGDLLQMVLEESEYTDMLLKDKSILPVLISIKGTISNCSKGLCFSPEAAII